MINSNFSQEFLDKRKADLLARKTELEEQLSSFAKKDPHQKGNYNTEFPEFGDQEEDNASEVAAFESNLSLEQTLEQSLEMITRGLSKIEDGTYGLCAKCGHLINEDRLEIMPTATRCTNSQKCSSNNE